MLVSGLLEWIGDKTETIIQNVPEDYRLAAAISLILWVIKKKLIQLEEAELKLVVPRGSKLTCSKLTFFKPT